MLLMFPFLNSLATRPYGRVMTALLILVCLPLGFPVGPELSLGSAFFLSGQPVSIPAELSLGSYLRPVLFFIRKRTVLTAYTIFHGSRSAMRLAG